jgi:hypothetical protein
LKATPFAKTLEQATMAAKLVDKWESKKFKYFGLWLDYPKKWDSATNQQIPKKESW